MSQQHAAIVFKTSRPEKCTDKNITCKNREAMVPLGIVQALVRVLHLAWSPETKEGQENLERNERKL